MAAAYLLAPEMPWTPQRCTKVPWESRKQAAIVFRAHRVHGGLSTYDGTFNVYRCAYCRMWHLGHFNRNKVRITRQAVKAIQ